MWSVGVILYILLCGYPPFPNQDLLRLVKHVTRGKYVFHEKYWGNISNEAKDLIRLSCLFVVVFVVIHISPCLGSY